jgi:hypothetical protein
MITVTPDLGTTTLSKMAPSNMTLAKIDLNETLLKSITCLARCKILLLLCSDSHASVQQK